MASHQCPNCGHPVEADFGVVICSHCQTALMFDLDGALKVSSDLDSPPQDLVQDVLVSELNEQMIHEPVDEPEINTLDGNFDTTNPNISLQDPPEDRVEAHETQPTDEFVEIIPLEETPIENSTEDSAIRFDDVVEFANQEMSGEALLYDIFIEDIDLSELRLQVAEVLKDSKLNLPENIMKNIKDGVLKIEGINAVKASVIVHGCSSLAVKVNWRQYAVTQA